MCKTIHNAFHRETERKPQRGDAAPAEMQALEGREMFSVSPLALSHDAGAVADLGAAIRPQIIGILIAL